MSECVIWTGPRQGGYGAVWNGRTWKRAHRLAWEKEHGPIPAGMTIDHLCCVKLCVNTDHMEVVTRAENTRRQVRTAERNARHAAFMRDWWRRHPEARAAFKERMAHG